MRYERDQRSVQVSLTENVVDVFVFVLATEHLLTGSALRMFNIFKNTKKRNKKKKETKIKHAKGIQTRVEQLRLSELQNVPLRERARERVRDFALLRGEPSYARRARGEFSRQAAAAANGRVAELQHNKYVLSCVLP